VVILVKLSVENSSVNGNLPLAHGWVFTGERDRPGCRFRRRAENLFPKLDGSTNVSGATPEPARETPALPPIVHPKMNSGKEFPSACI
jgi:hypothetical protein